MLPCTKYPGWNSNNISNLTRNIRYMPFINAIGLSINIIANCMLSIGLTPDIIANYALSQFTNFKTISSATSKTQILFNVCNHLFGNVSATILNGCHNILIIAATLRQLYLEEPSTWAMCNIMSIDFFNNRNIFTVREYIFFKENVKLKLIEKESDWKVPIITSTDDKDFKF
jgi:hypothetical protein